jgi:hypothetical protein
LEFAPAGRLSGPEYAVNGRVCARRKAQAATERHGSLSPQLVELRERLNRLRKVSPMQFFNGHPRIDVPGMESSH